MGEGSWGINTHRCMPTCSDEREEGCRGEINVPEHIKLMLVILIKGKDGVECKRKSKN